MRVDLFDWDDANLDHLGKHNISQLEADSLLDQRFIVLKNKRRRAGEYRIVGRTGGGRMLTIVVVSHPEEGVWRPVTGWDADDEERAHARKAGI